MIRINVANPPRYGSYPWRPDIPRSCPQVHCDVVGCSTQAVAMRADPTEDGVHEMMALCHHHLVEHLGWRRQS